MEPKMEVSSYSICHTIQHKVAYLVSIIMSIVDNPIKSRKMKIKLPWELSTIYSEYLGGVGGDDREEEDEDDIEAHEDSLQRLKVSSL